MQKNFKDSQNFDMKSFLSNLNEPQKEAVLTFGRPQLVLSGAGSGKTRVLTYKIIYLIKVKNIPPENILALTFTKKAANEMKERIFKLIGENLTIKLIMGTFHSVFCKILRKNITYLEGSKYKANFQIILEHESIDIIKSIIDEKFQKEFENYLELMHITDSSAQKNELKSLSKKIFKKISLLKNKGITYDKYLNCQDEIDKDLKIYIPFFKNIYQAYVETCHEKNVMDFEDLLLNTFLLFNDTKNVSILNKYQDLFKYILVDEYQDTNIVQYEIVKALAWKNKNIFVVGDDYQNIYSFRGANRLNIDKFKENFNNYKETKLCQNYRSHEIIVKAANKLILNNKHQIKKELFSNIEPDEKIKLIYCLDGIDEANKIAFLIQKLKLNNSCNYSDIVILYRKNIQHIPFKNIFFKRGIPHKIYNANTIFESKIIKVIYYYLQYIDDQSLDFCLNKIINFPKRNIGIATINKLFSLAKSNGITCWDIINNCDDEIKIKKYKITKDLQKKLPPFKSLITSLISFSKTKSVYDTVLELFKYININNYTKEESTKEQINMLLDKINEMEQENIANNIEKFTLNDFLENFSLLTSNEENDKNESKNDKVKLMTIHQAKGLEFKYVFIVGLEEGNYPCDRNFDIEELEEERRIFYVALTRAKINCFLSYAEERKIGEETKKRRMSPFLVEISDYKFIERWESESDDNYINYKHQIKNESEENTFIKFNKFSKIGKFRKYDNKYSYNENNENKNNIINNNINNNNYDFGNCGFVKASEYLKNNINQIRNLDINQTNYINKEKNIENSLAEKNVINNQNNNLNKEINIKMDYIRNGKKQKEIKSIKDKKTMNKSKLKFKLIDSFFTQK